MNHRQNTRIIVALGVGLAAGALLTGGGGMAHLHAADGKPTEVDVPALKAEVERLKGLAPDQSHAMSDVEYHYTNLWFAGSKGSWDLAQFYCNEVKSHLRWAVRIIPVRKDDQGRDVDLRGILTGIETSSLKELDATIKAKDSARFRAAYEAQLRACYSCHQASSKPYIRLHIPEQPGAHVVQFDPSGPAVR